MWDHETLRLLESSAYALIISRQLVLDFQRGPARNIYESRLDIRQAQDELAARNIKALTREINKEREIVAHVPS